MTAHTILTWIQDWSGILALVIATISLRLSYLRFRASVAEKMPDIRLMFFGWATSEVGDYLVVRYEIKNRSDKNLHILELKVTGGGQVRYCSEVERDSPAGPFGPKAFRNTQCMLKTHLRPSGSVSGASGSGGDNSYSNQWFQTTKTSGKLKFQFIYAFSSEDEKKYRKAFVREIPAKQLG